ncbi:hypothetical protein CRG98_010044 [Punica granatum]|uniref:Uncharacterized protein n=1 Tax=Punica granatum TaxID=22663 RepID=A0A2I0KM46_PUNGR|nr:hypothetical protein CRG98_010044 [Punica granatum]
MQMNMRLHWLPISTHDPRCFDYLNPRVVGKLKTDDIALVLKMIFEKSETMQCGPPRPVANVDRSPGSPRVCENPKGTKGMIGLPRSSPRTLVSRPESPEIKQKLSHDMRVFLGYPCYI